MFDGYRNFGDYVLNFNYALVDAKGYDDESLFNELTQNYGNGMKNDMILNE